MGAMQELFYSCAGVDAAKPPRHPRELTVADIGFQILSAPGRQRLRRHAGILVTYLSVAADKVEFALARWLGRQLRQLQVGTQSESRAAQLAVLMALQNTGSGLRHPRGEWDIRKTDSSTTDAWRAPEKEHRTVIW